MRPETIHILPARAGPGRVEGRKTAKTDLASRMSEQKDIAEDLGVVPPALPEIESLRQFAENMPAPPPQIIEGVLHQACKRLSSACRQVRVATPLSVPAR